MNGILLVNKKRDWTSFDVCARIRKIFNEKKVGHTGTLDPFAEGLMIIALGSATKVIPFLEDANKEYVAELKLGKATETEDLTGKVIEEKEIPSLTNENIEAVLNSFLGDSYQVPPMYSAIKYNGLPLYMYARDGVNVERKPRLIHIYDIKLLSFSKDTIKFSALVSKGTYIRTLGTDIAKKLNTVGYLHSLNRTKIASYDVKDSKDVNELTIEDLSPLESVLKHFVTVVADETMERDIRNGKPLILSSQEDLVYLKSELGTPLAIYMRDKENLFKSKRGLFS